MLYVDVVLHTNPLKSGQCWFKWLIITLHHAGNGCNSFFFPFPSKKPLTNRNVIKSLREHFISWLALLMLFAFPFTFLFLFPSRMQILLLHCFLFCFNHDGSGGQRTWLLTTRLEAWENAEWKVTVLLLFVLKELLYEEMQSQASRTLCYSLKKKHTFSTGTTLIMILL